MTLELRRNSYQIHIFLCSRNTLPTILELPRKQDRSQGRNRIVLILFINKILFVIAIYFCHSKICCKQCCWCCCMHCEQKLNAIFILLDRNDIRVSCIGDKSILSKPLREALTLLEEKTKSNSGLHVMLALNYVQWKTWYITSNQKNHQ